MARHVSLSNLGTSVKPDKTKPRVWKLPLQKEDAWVGVRCLWCRPDTAQECAISGFLQHQKNQTARDHLPAYRPTISPLRGPLSGNCSKCLAVPGHLRVCFFIIILFSFALLLLLFALSDFIFHHSNNPVPQSTLCKVLKGLGHILGWRPMPCHKEIEVFALREVFIHTQALMLMGLEMWHLAGTAFCRVVVHKAQAAGYYGSITVLSDPQWTASATNVELSDEL